LEYFVKLFRLESYHIASEGTLGVYANAQWIEVDL
jgi:hypothetical protein